MDRDRQAVDFRSHLRQPRMLQSVSGRRTLFSINLDIKIVIK
jgi:hypothetical protein